MSKFQNLILKAMSTDSDAEALSCLRLAKKEKHNFNPPTPRITDGMKYHKYSVRAWRYAAIHNHEHAERLTKQLVAEQQTASHYKNQYTEATRTVMIKLVTVTVVAFTSGITIGILMVV